MDDVNVETRPLVFERTRVPMRDGVTLDALQFRLLDGVGPTLVLRTPYGVENLNAMASPDFMSLVNAGYNVVWVGCRGTYGSDGRFAGLIDEHDDGQDTIDWVLTQAWSDGRIGLFGGSYTGYTQWAVAAGGRAEVHAMAIRVSSADWYSAPWYSPGGVLNFDMVTRWHMLMRAAEQRRSVARGELAAADEALLAQVGRSLEVSDDVSLSEHPLVTADARLSEIIARPSRDGFWRERDHSSAFERMTQPVLMVAGWFDHFLAAQLDDFVEYRRRAASTAAREGTRIVIGPWTHGPFENYFPQADFGPASGSAGADLNGEHVRHFARYLPIEQLDVDPSVPGDHPAAVRAFIMGADEWRDFDTWPVPGVEMTPWYLGADRELRLDVQPGADDVTFRSDPRDPVPTVGGNSAGTYRLDGPADQRGISSRADVVAFTSRPLAYPVTVVGEVHVRLFVSADVPDADVVAVLVDVHPDGREMRVCDGALRLRYRGGTDAEQLLEPGECYEVEVHMSATGIRFDRGHRIAVHLAGSSFPRYQRNTHTGNVISDEPIERGLVATLTVHTGERFPSALVLPQIH